MVEITIPEKLTETIVNMLKKGNVFSKIKKIECLVYGCAILVTIFGTSIIINSYVNTGLLMDNNKEQNNNQLLISKQNNTLQKLHYKVDRVIEFNKQLMILLFDKKDSDITLPQQNNDPIIYVKSSVSSLSSMTYEENTVELDMIDEERAEKH